MNVRLLVDASEFMDALASDMSQAVDTAFVQAMTFEGDAAEPPGAACGCGS